MTEWIADKKPEPDKRVFITIGAPRPYVTIARWIPKFYMEDMGDFEGDTEYCERDYSYYWPSGWYEEMLETEQVWRISDPVLAWAELPRPWSGKWQKI